MEATAVTIDNHPMWVDLEKAYPELEGYPEAELDRKVLTVIACYANSQGIAFPLQATIADIIEEIKMNVNRSVHRLIDKRLIKILRKEKKYNDIHPRCIYGVASDMVRETPDTRSSHFDAEKWRVIAARLKKHVADAVDTVKQVAVDAAKSMSAAKSARKPRKQRKQWNNSYRNNSWQRNSYSVPAQPLSPEERERKQWIDRLIEQGKDALEKAHMTSDGEFEAERYIHKRLLKTPEKYDQILHEAIDKFKDFQNLNCWETRVQLGLDPLGMYKQRQSDSASEVRLMSSEDEPKTLGSMLGGALA